MRVIVGKTYRVNTPNPLRRVVAYIGGQRMWVVEDNTLLTVTAWPTQGNLPKYAGGGKEQWADVLLPDGQACAVWNLSCLELVEP